LMWMCVRTRWPLSCWRSKTVCFLRGRSIRRGGLRKRARELNSTQRSGRSGVAIRPDLEGHAGVELAGKAAAPAAPPASTPCPCSTASSRRRGGKGTSSWREAGSSGAPRKDRRRRAGATQDGWSDPRRPPCTRLYFTTQSQTHLQPENGDGMNRRLRRFHRFRNLQPPLLTGQLRSQPAARVCPST
jgi:hypothetical protein